MFKKLFIFRNTETNHLHNVLFHHQISTGIVNVKFRAVNVVLLPGTSSGSKWFCLLLGTLKVVPAKAFDCRVPHCNAVMHRLWIF